MNVCLCCTCTDFGLYHRHARASRCSTGSDSVHVTVILAPSIWRPPLVRHLPPNKRLKLTARVDYGVNLSSARRSLSAIR
jgi:hypothetical protein